MRLHPASLSYSWVKRARRTGGSRSSFGFCYHVLGTALLHHQPSIHKNNGVGHIAGEGHLG